MLRREMTHRRSALGGSCSSVAMVSTAGLRNRLVFGAARDSTWSAPNSWSRPPALPAARASPTFFLCSCPLLVECHRQELPAILDMKWALKDHQQAPLLALVTADGMIMLFALRGEADEVQRRRGLYGIVVFPRLGCVPHGLTVCGTPWLSAAHFASVPDVPTLRLDASFCGVVG